MATFFGGLQLDSVSALTGDSDSTQAVKYTVPAGRFTEVNVVVHTTGGTGLEINPAGVATASNRNILLTDANDAGLQVDTFWLNTGDAIELTASSGTTSYRFVIKEYITP